MIDIKNKNNDDKNNFADFSLVDTKEITSVLGMKRLNANDVYFECIVKDIVGRRNLPSIFFVSSKQESLNIYLKAKKMKRRVLYISPSTIPFRDTDLKDKDVYIEQYLNYKSCVLNNYVVIVDIEYMLNKEESRAFMLNILSIVERTLAEMDNTIFDDNVIVFDDVYIYSSHLRDLLYKTKAYNTGLVFMIKQINGSFDEFELRCLFEESINKILLPSLYLKDRNEILKSYDVDKGDKVYFIKNNDLSVVDELENINFDDFELMSDKLYRSMIKVFNNKVSKFEKSILKDLSIDNADNSLNYFNEFNGGSNLSNVATDAKCSVTGVSNDISSEYKVMQVGNFDDNKEKNKNSEFNMENMNNKKEENSLAEKLKLSLQGYNSNREELDFSFDDDDFIE